MSKFREWYDSVEITITGAGLVGMVGALVMLGFLTFVGIILDWVGVLQ